jgi:predicted HicB family RNase H-like nuclease
MRKTQYQNQLTIAIPPEHFKQIKRISDEQDISLAQWVIEAENSSIKMQLHTFSIFCLQNLCVTTGTRSKLTGLLAW